MMKKTPLSRVVINTVLFILSIMWMLPIVLAIVNAAKSRIEYNTTDIWNLPVKWVYHENFIFLQEYFSIFTSMYSTFLYSICGSSGAVIIATLAAYGLTHLPIRRKVFWFMFIYSAAFFPFQIYLIPLFRAYNFLGLYNTRQGMIFFYIAICIPFAMFVMRNFFSSISREVLESAKIDGASSLTILLRILVPMSVAPLTLVFFNQFKWCWNELMFGLTLTKSTEVRPVTVTISLLRSTSIPPTLLACVIVSVPMLALFSFLQKNLEVGIVYQSK